MALAQQTDLLLLDEPTTFLDVSHQIEVLDLLTDLNRSRGTTVVMVLHDLNMAARYADHLVALRSGRIHATGAPAQVLTEESVRAVFGLDSRVIVDPTSGKPLMLPIGRHHLAVPADALPGPAGACPRSLDRADRLPLLRLEDVLRAAPPPVGRDGP
jgi:iron complex transport system ATP-binding protein